MVCYISLSESTAGALTKVVIFTLGPLTPSAGHDKFLKRVTGAFHKFIEEREEACRKRTIEDLESTTKFVSWSLHNRDPNIIRKFLEEQSSARASRSDGTSNSSSPKSKETKDRVCRRVYILLYACFKKQWDT